MLEFPCYCDSARNSLSGTIGVCSRIILDLPFCLAFHYTSTRKTILIGCCRLVPFPPEIPTFSCRLPLLRFSLLARRVPKDDLGSLGNLFTCNTGERQEVKLLPGACVYLCDAYRPLIVSCFKHQLFIKFHGDIEWRGRSRRFF
jgi:hypothetical protein